MDNKMAEKKPIKIKYGTAGIVYIFSYFLAHKYYPELYAYIGQVREVGATTKDAIIIVLMLFLPFLFLSMAND